jgi:hypothetical protein
VLSTRVTYAISPWELSEVNAFVIIDICPHTFLHDAARRPSATVPFGPLRSVLTDGF